MGGPGDARKSSLTPETAEKNDKEGTNQAVSTRQLWHILGLQYLSSEGTNNPKGTPDTDKARLQYPRAQTPLTQPALPGLILTPSTEKAPSPHGLTNPK